MTGVSDLRIDRSHCSKGQLRSSYFLFKEWNEIPLKVSNSESIGSFTSLSIILDRKNKTYFLFSILRTLRSFIV